MPELVNAAVLHAFAQPLQLRRIPMPRLRPGYVLVRVEASGVNPLDTKIRAGLAGHARTEPPAVLGIDLAGTVEMVADDVAAFTLGDRVYGIVMSRDIVCTCLAKQPAAETVTDTDVRRQVLLVVRREPTLRRAQTRRAGTVRFSTAYRRNPYVVGKNSRGPVLVRTIRHAWTGTRNAWTCLSCTTRSGIRAHRPARGDARGELCEGFDDCLTLGCL
jgi:hypothetical protein